MTISVIVTHLAVIHNDLMYVCAEINNMLQILSVLHTAVFNIWTILCPADGTSVGKKW